MRLLLGDALEQLKTLESATVQTCVTSPPYFGLRDYGVAGQIGLEETPEAYTQKLVEVFREVRRVLKDDGTLWLNLGDSYASDTKGGRFKHKLSDKQGTNLGSKIDDVRHLDLAASNLKPKDIIGIPWRVAFALQADGWYLRQDIIWHKPNPMPESVTDRCTKAHEYIFLLSKSQHYYFNNKAIMEPSIHAGVIVRSGATLPTDDVHFQTHVKGERLVADKRNKRSVWTVTTKPFKGAHFATFPPDLIEPCILAGAMGGDIVIDPFTGSGTTGVVSKRLGRDFIGIELNPTYHAMAQARLDATPTPLL